MFRTRFFVFYSPDGGDGGGGGAGGSGDPAGGTAPGTTQPTGGGGPGGSNTSAGNTAESFYKDKIDSLHNDLSSTRATNKTLGEKLSAAEAELAGYKLAEKKAGILSGIQEKLGDFEIPADKLAKLQGVIKVLPDGEDLSDKITEMVDLIKMPKGKEEPPPFSSFSGGQPTGNVPGTNRQTFTPGEQLTPGQLANLSTEDHARYLQSLRTHK